MRAVGRAARVTLAHSAAAKNIPSDVVVMQQAHVTGAFRAGSALHMKLRWPRSMATSHRINSNGGDGGLFVGLQMLFCYGKKTQILLTNVFEERSQGGRSVLTLFC